MTAATHLKSLQALEMAIREGSLKDAAARLGITPAAVGQRIRALEDYLGTDLLLRGRSGLKPTADLAIAQADLKSAFAALDRVTAALDFRRVTEIHVVADTDWAELWLLPRLPAFRDVNPNILFCINGVGDVPLRLGAPDCRIEYGNLPGGDVLFRDRMLPVTGPDNLRRLAVWDDKLHMEGLPLLHLEAQRDDPLRPGWPEWFDSFGQRIEGVGRGVHYKHARLALEAVRQEVGFLACGLSLIQEDLDAGRVVLPFPPHQSIEAPMPYSLRISDHAVMRPQVQRFRDWLCAEGHATANFIATAAADQAPTASSALR